MQAIFRESIVGQAINSLSKGKLLPYPEERRDFVVPAHFSISHDEKPKTTSATTGAHSADVSRTSTLSPNSRQSTPPSSDLPHSGSQRSNDSDAATLTDVTAQNTVEKATHPQQPRLEEGKPPNLVGWYGDDDPENPQNWSTGRKALFMICLQILTFAVYIGSAIYTPSIGGVMQEFGVSQTKALLGLSMYVLAYGIGIPSFGRLNVYMVTLFIFVILQIPTALAPNFDTLIAMRFFAGLVCSPALSTGGASVADVFPPMVQPYMMALWAAGAVAGPVTGPVAGGFAAQEENWRWPLYILLFLSLFAFLLLAFFFPETSSATILLRRAQRLRKLTGNDKLRSESEIEQAELSPVQVMSQSLIRPFQLFREPIVLFIDLYIALVYAIFYLWFEAFPLVFTDIYGFNLGLSGLPFVGFIVALVPTLAVYFAYQKYSVIPTFERDGFLVPESRLKVALVGSLFIPVALFIFGWTSKPGVSYWGAIVGASLYLPGIYLIFQGAIVYLPMSYGKYAASVLAGNALLRGITGAVFPLFGHALFVNLGIGPGSSMLAGLSIAMIPPLYFLYKRGDKLRAMSRYASESH